MSNSCQEELSKCVSFVGFGLVAPLLCGPLSEVVGLHHISGRHAMSGSRNIPEIRILPIFCGLSELCENEA